MLMDNIINVVNHMRNIIIVQCSSTGFNFVQDIIDRNYNPVVLEMNPLGDFEAAEIYMNEVRGTYDLIDNYFDMIYEKDTYEETLEEVRKWDPLLVVPGTEDGVILATRLAHDLGLLGNPIENIDAMTLKDEMHNKIREHGLRSIKGRVVSSVEEAIEYYDSENFKEVVLKPVYSAASVGVRICMNKDEVISSAEELLQGEGVYGNKVNEILVQERINGEEYIVNTVSCNGVHRVTTMWKYTKVKTSEGGHVYDTIETVNHLGLGEAEIVEYAYDVADALGIRYGPVHGEYMVDENGPVLIEVNCRPCGATMEAAYLDRISGQHETDSVLDSYLNPDKFDYERDKGYKLYAYGALKLFIVPDDIFAESSPMNHIDNKLKSHYATSLMSIGDGHLFVKTQDFETTGGCVYMVHEDGYVLKQDIEFLRSVEKYAFQLVLSDGSDKKAFLDNIPSIDEIKSFLGTVSAYGQTLFVTDQIHDDVDLLQVSPKDIDDVKGKFSCVVVNLNESIINQKDDIIINLFLRIIEKVKLGGLIFIPKSTFQYVPHGRIGVEALIKVLDLELELPLHNYPRMVIASKRMTR